MPKPYAESTLRALNAWRKEHRRLKFLWKRYQQTRAELRAICLKVNLHPERLWRLFPDVPRVHLYQPGLCPRWKENVNRREMKRKERKETK